MKYHILIFIILAAFLSSCGNGIKVDLPTAESITSVVTLETADSEFLTSSNTFSVSFDVTDPDETAFATTDIYETQDGDDTSGEHKHSYKIIQIIEPATCSKTGLRRVRCKICGYETVKVTWYSEHDDEVEYEYENGQPVLAIKTCRVCGSVRREELYFGWSKGITRQNVVNYLSFHENDQFYLGTPYKGFCYSFPRGDAAYTLLGDEDKKKSVEENGVYLLANINGSYPHSEGKPQMNCGGFVGHVLNSVSNGFTDYFASLAAPYANDFYVSQNYTDVWLWYVIMTHNTSAGTYQTSDKQTSFTLHKYPTVEEMLASGILKKGDIIMSVPQGSFGDLHIGFFWGDSPYDNKFWHSTSGGNKISKIVNYNGKTPSNYYWYVISLAEGKETKDCGSVSVYLSENGLPKSGAKFELKKSGITVAEMITGASGYATTYRKKLVAGDYTLALINEIGEKVREYTVNILDKQYGNHVFLKIDIPLSGTETAASDSIQ